VSAVAVEVVSPAPGEIITIWDWPELGIKHRAKVYRYNHSPKYGPCVDVFVDEPVDKAHEDVNGPYIYRSIKGLWSNLRTLPVSHIIDSGEQLREVERRKELQRRRDKQRYLRGKFEVEHGGCKNDHPKSDQVVTPKGRTYCRRCKADANRAYNQGKRHGVSAE
jgi:hypothetical protein